MEVRYVNVNWGKIIMDGIVIAIIGLIAAIMTQVIADFKGYRKIADKIGNHKSDTLEGQHERIKEIVVEKTNGVEKIIAAGANGIAERQRSIFSKVDSIDKEMAANKDRYTSLNLDQRDIRDSVGKLVNEWEHAITENKELKSRIMEMEKQIEKMGKQYDEIEAKNKELEKQNKDMSVRHRKTRGMDNEIDM